MFKVGARTYFSFLIYLPFMLGIGIYFFYRTRTLSDYTLGGRTLRAWVTAMSAFASDMSGWLLMGLPGFAFAAGLSETFWCALGLVIALSLYRRKMTRNGAFAGMIVGRITTIVWQNYFSSGQCLGHV